MRLSIKAENSKAIEYYDELIKVLDDAINELDNFKTFKKVILG